MFSHLARICVKRKSEKNTEKKITKKIEKPAEKNYAGWGHLKLKL